MMSRYLLTSSTLKKCLATSRCMPRQAKRGRSCISQQGNCQNASASAALPKYAAGIIWDNVAMEYNTPDNEEACTVADLRSMRSLYSSAPSALS